MEYQKIIDLKKNDATLLAHFLITVAFLKLLHCNKAVTFCNK